MKLVEEYRNSLKMIEVEEILDLIFYRPFAFLFVKTIYNTNITPNQISFIALAIGVAAGIIFLWGTYPAYIIAAFLIIVYDILDCSDGQLARMKKTGTLIGRIIDGFSDYIVTVFVYIGMAIGYSSQTGDALYAWSLTAVAGASNAIHSITLDYYRNVFMDNALGRADTLGESLIKFEDEYQRLRNEKRYSFEVMLLWIYLKYSALQIKFAPEKSVQYDPDNYYKKNKIILHLWTYLGPTTELSFLIICAFLNRLDIFLWGMIVVGNSYALILYLIQTRINKSLILVESD